MKKAILKLTMNSLAVATLFSGCGINNRSLDVREYTNFIEEQKLVGKSDDQNLKNAPIWVLNPDIKIPNYNVKVVKIEKLADEKFFLESTQKFFQETKIKTSWITEMWISPNETVYMLFSYYNDENGELDKIIPNKYMVSKQERISK